MSTHPTPEQAQQRMIVQGKAMVRLLESIDVLLTNSGSWRETWLLKATRSLYSHRLRQLVAVLPPNVSAKLLAASENIKGPVGDVSQN
jgi:hypothetical protein